MKLMKCIIRPNKLEEVREALSKLNVSGMTVSEARRLKELEAENAKLKRLLAEAELDKAALKDLLGRKW